MKKMILMAAFAAISFAASAQNAPATASTSGTTDKKECANKTAACCAHGAASGTASTASITPEVKSVSKSKAKKSCCADGAKAACSEAKAATKPVN